MPRAIVHVGCPEGGKFYTAYIQQGPRGQVKTVPIGQVCDGCGLFLKAGGKPISAYVPGQAPKRKGGRKGGWTLEEVRQAREELVAMGHVHQIGVNEQGEAIWALTPEGRAFAEDYFAKHPEERPRDLPNPM